MKVRRLLRRLLLDVDTAIQRPTPLQLAGAPEHMSGIEGVNASPRVPYGNGHEDARPKLQEHQRQRVQSEQNARRVFRHDCSIKSR